ncbi:MAG: ABC transporter substrate-binding protein [Gemmatimonadota bacterium]|nr:ABC transporter substrate-binding protein [Gemmatimonadota bacterium]
MNTRRFAVAALFALATALAAGVTGAQQAAKMVRVGALFNRGPNLDDIEQLKKGLARLGYVEGIDIVIEARFAEGKLDRLPGFAAELVAMGVDVIAAYGGPPTRAARGATATIPIVAALVADPVALGFAATLARPGGNVTGATNHDAELAILQLRILREVFPRLARVAFLSDADIPGADSTGLVPIERSNVAAAAAMSITPQMLKLRGPTPDLVKAFDALAAEKAEVLVVLEVPVPFTHRDRIAELAAERRIPTMFWGGASNAGGMMSYGTSFVDNYPHIAEYIDRILKGARPADMPFAVITRREFVVNRKVARQLGVPVPDEVLKRADRIID